jgi:hypothetical protein
MRSYGPLVSATDLFRRTRAQVREAQRQELKDRTHQELVGLGREITFLTDEGATIQEIEHAMGSKSRTLIYEAKRAYAASNQPQQPKPEPEVTGEAYTLEHVQKNAIDVVWSDGSRDFMYLTDGVVTQPPISWAGLDKTKDERRLYARIIAEAEQLAAK